MYQQNYAPGQTFPTLQMALEMQTVSDLKELAGLLTKTAKPTRKADLIHLIESYFTDENMRGLWNRLDTLQQAAIAEVVYGPDNRFASIPFKAKYGESPNWGTPHEWGSQVDPSLLWLFFYGGIMPDDVRERLKAFVPPPVKTVLATLAELPPTLRKVRYEFDYKARKREERIEEIPVIRRETALAASHELLAVLRLVGAGKVTVSDKTSLPTATTLKAITALLDDGDYYDDGTADAPEEDDEKIGSIRAFAWPLLLQAGKLVELTGKRLTVTAAGQKALSAPVADTLRNLWRAWLKTTLLDELRRINAIRGQTGKGKYGLTAPTRRRTVIASALADCPPQCWINLDQFLNYMRAAHYDFEVTRNEWSLYISDPNYGSLGNGGDTWPILQASYIRCLLFEYAATLGMIDVAYASPADACFRNSDFWGMDELRFLSRYDGLGYFRLTSLGAYCLGLTETYTPPQAEDRSILRVLPNRDIVITATDYSRGDTLLLGLYTQQISERVWRLEEGKMLIALEEGHPVTDLREFLETRSAEALPANIQQFLQDFETRSQRLQDRGEAHLIACSDPILLQLITHDPRTKKTCFAAGDSHFVVPAESLGAFRKALRQLGYVIPPRSADKPVKKK